MKKVRVGLVIAILLCITMITLIGCKDNTVSSRNKSVDLDKRAAMVEEFEKTKLTFDDYENQVVTPNKSVQKALVELNDANKTYELIRRRYVQLRKSPSPEEVDVVARELAERLHPHYCIKNITYVPEDLWEVRGISSFSSFSVYIMIERNREYL
jgi:predicted Holliday junction resolvase-like endonuclease